MAYMSASTKLDRDIRVEQRVQTILGWPTDTLEIDYIDDSQLDGAGGSDPQSLDYPHTVFIFVPGNPGLIGWYIPSLMHLLHVFGQGFAARGVSYAGHGSSDDIADVERWISSKERDTEIPWTVDGQIQHKVAYLDLVADQLEDRRQQQQQQQQQQQEALTGTDKDINNNQQQQSSSQQNRHKTRFIWLGHSIGCHMIQRVLVLRPDILRQTDLVIHLMPFNRMKSPKSWEWFLNFCAQRPNTVIGHAQSFIRILASLPLHVLDTLLKGDIHCENGREISVNLLQQPHFGRNFFELGLEEVRDLPELIDACACRIIGAQCPISILYVGQDKWAPRCHMTDIRALQDKGEIPPSIHCTYLPHIVHDYPVRPQMVVDVDAFCEETIRKHVVERQNGMLRSKL